MTPLVTPTSQEPSVLKNFQTFLVSKNYSSSTIRNYLSDVGNYFEFVENCELKIENSNLFSSDVVSFYLQTIQKNPAYSRYLSSLSKFFQFAQDQDLTKTNPLKAALRDKKPGLDEIINQYSDFLNKKNFSQSTIKNYLNDIRQFVDWSQQTNSNLQNPNNQ